MAKNSKRILLDSLDLIDLSSEDSTDTPLPGTDPDPYALPSLAPAFSFNKNALPGYGTTLPVAAVDFSFPADDQRRVQAWFSGDFSHVTEPESSTLKKNMTAAVKATLDAFISTALSRNLFSSPCMIGWQYRLFDGSCAGPEAIGCSPTSIIPVSSAPDLIITSYNVYDKSLHTDVAFSQTPAQLLLNIDPPEKGAEFRDIITAVEFFITRPVALYPSDMTVSGVRSISIDGVRERVWQYTSYDSDTLLAMASADRDFRIVASIPFSDILDGKYKSAQPLPIEAGALSRFSSLPKQSASRWLKVEIELPMRRNDFLEALFFRFYTLSE